MAVKEELKKLGLHFVLVDLGVVDIMENISPEQRDQLRTRFAKFRSGTYGRQESRTYREDQKHYY